MSERVELELKLKGGDKAVKTLGQLEKELNDARDAIKEVEVGSQAFETLAQKIQKTGSEIKTLEKGLEGLEPQQKAEAFLKMGEGIAGGFAIMQGSLALAGVESEDLEKIQVKVQAAISIAMGVRMMSEAALMATTAKRVVAEKLAIVQSKLGIVVTKGQAVATGIAATAQGVWNGTIALTTVGLKALKLAIAATGIGALVIAILAIGKAVYDWATATDNVTQSQANLNRELANQNNEFLKNRKLQQELSAANTEAERELVRLTNRLNENETALNENSDKLNKNADNLENLGDHSKESQRIIQNNTTTLQKNSTTLQNNVDILDLKIAAVQKEIAAEQDKEQKDNERRQRSSQRRSERKAQREKDAEDLRALQEEAKRLSLERIQDEETRELALLKFEKDLQLEKIQDATNYEEQRLLIEEKFTQKRKDIQKGYVEDTVDGLLTISTEGENILNELEQKRQERLDAEQANYLQREQNKADFKASMDTQGFELAKALGGKNEKVQKKIAIAETAFFTGKSIMRALADIPAPFGLIQAGIHGAMGIAQIANIKSEKTGGASGVGGTDVPDTMIPASTGAFSLGGVEQQAVKAFVVESEITDSQAQMEDINRRSTI